MCTNCAGVGTIHVFQTLIKSAPQVEGIGERIPMKLILSGASPEASLKARLEEGSTSTLDKRTGAGRMAMPATWSDQMLAVIRRAVLSLGAVAAFTVSAVAHAQSVAPAAAADSRPVVVLNTSEGDIVLELDQQRAPATVENFLSYVDDGFYAGTLFHRVIDGFMVQGGGFTEDYQRKPTKAPVSNEAYNGLTNRKYTIAMARTTNPHSATSQFFINTADNRNLDHTDTSQRGWGYTVFGTVIEGTEVVDAISRTRTGPGGPFSRDAPVEPVVILGADLVQETESDSSAVPSTTPDETSSESSDGASAEPSTTSSIVAKPADSVATAKPDSTDIN